MHVSAKASALVLETSATTLSKGAFATRIFSTHEGRKVGLFCHLEVICFRGAARAAPILNVNPIWKLELIHCGLVAARPGTIFRRQQICCPEFCVLAGTSAHLAPAGTLLISNHLAVHYPAHFAGIPRLPESSLWLRLKHNGIRPYTDYCAHPYAAGSRQRSVPHVGSMALSGLSIIAPPPARSRSCGGLSTAYGLTRFGVKRGLVAKLRRRLSRRVTTWAHPPSAVVRRRGRRFRAEAGFGFARQTHLVDACRRKSTGRNGHGARCGTAPIARPRAPATRARARARRRGARGCAHPRAIPAPTRRRAIPSAKRACRAAPRRERAKGSCR
eukprot:2251772-Pleurochrysis_carterae.AAC.2